MSQISKCPKCKGEMIQGIVPDFGYGAVFGTSWREGPPKKRFLGGIKVPARKGIPIATFRCNECGYLEFYSKDEFAPQ